MTRLAPRLYDRACEPAWQQRWEDAGLFRTRRRPGHPKWFVVELPPFANGRLHLGHVRNYVISDVLTRFRRALGYDVLYTTGFDCFGLPSEYAAREEGVAPSVLVDRYRQAMTGQLHRLGLSHDRARFYSDHEPDYYRWVQWVFLRLFAHGHAFRRRSIVNWCTTCHTTLADSLVEQGHCWRCCKPVRRVEMEQWFIRETALVDRLIDEELPGWPETIKRIHRDWIGRQQGFECELWIEPHGVPLRVFSPTPDGPERCAFVAAAPDHPQLRQCGMSAAAAAAADSGLTVVDPSSGRSLPLLLVQDPRTDTHGTWLGYPEDDELDRRIWQSLGCPSRAPASAQSPRRARAPQDAIRYRLRDWDIARPRYWGTPVPIIHCPGCGQVPVPEADLPVLLPSDIDPRTPGNPLERRDDFLSARCPRCCGNAQRDTHTLEAYSSPWWFYLICRDSRSDHGFDHPGVARWMPVDLMVGGADQARTCFFHLRTMAAALTDLGITEDRHPVRSLLAIGMIKADGRKMSKSGGNGVDPSALIERYGADPLRLAMLAAAAPDQDVNWHDDLVVRAARFLSSLVRFFARHDIDFRRLPSQLEPHDPARQRLLSWLHAAGRNVTGSLQRNAPHVAAQQVTLLAERIFELEGQMAKRGAVDNVALAFAARFLLRLLAPLAPHAAEELWSQSGGEGMLAAQDWPVPADAADPAEAA